MVRGEYATHSCLLIAADAQISFYIARITEGIYPRNGNLRISV